MTESSTTTSKMPSHIAMIMDGNGRWAVKRGKKRVQGHKAGMERAREMVQACGELGVKVLTLFAFSSENWNRPKDEVSFLMNLFITGLTKEAKTLHKNNVQLRVIGDVSQFESKLQKAIEKSVELTKDNDGIVLQIAANYGGQWDMVQAVNAAITEQLIEKPTEKPLLTAEHVERNLCGSDLPHPDLLIRTGGEHRISNFLLWQAAYSELYFSSLLWPDFDKKALIEAIDDYNGRQRRFGKTGEQVEQSTDN